MKARKSTLFMVFLVVSSLFMLGLFSIHPLFQIDDYERGMEKRKQLVRELRLTDLCLFTEARYTRHISQADFHSPFQDYPTAFDHFPSGSLVAPPAHLIARQP